MYLLKPYYRRISLFLSDYSNRSFRIAAMAIFTPLGALPMYTTALGMLLAEPSISSLVYGNVILALIAAILSFYLLKNRTSAFNTSLFVLFWSILMLAPRPLGAPPSRIK